jgi:lipid-A-disaccharide synthase
MISSPLHSAALPANLSQGYLACVAGEPSGDMLAASVLAGIKDVPTIARLPTRGVGGPKMIAEGFDAKWPLETLAVRGYVEAIKQLPSILSLRRALVKDLLEHPPNAFLGIDAPDFNLGVEKQLKATGIPTIHFISPSIWAWRGDRIKGIQESVDRMLCIFPFEPEIYHKVGMSATYVGHPLASQIPMVPNTSAAKLKLGVNADKALVAIMPGSRQSEVRMIAPGFLKAMVLMYQQFGSDIEFVLPVATPALKPQILELLQPINQQFPDIKIHLLDGQASLALEACDVVLIASGTATLEAALWKKPMVISYQVPAITAWIMRRQAYLPYVGLPNILAGEFIVPELLQEQGSPEALAKATLALLDQRTEVHQLVERFTEMHHSLNLPTGKLVAKVIAEVIEGSHA